MADPLDVAQTSSGLKVDLPQRGEVRQPFADGEVAWVVDRRPVTIERRYRQRRIYVDTLSGIGVSLQIVFAVVLGGVYVVLGPTVGTALTIALSEYLRIYFGIKLVGIAETIYGLALILVILFIIFLPAGIWGSLIDLVLRAPARGVGPGRVTATP